jgi:beta-phosphoglucomutase-like phosphatase (HAD superfamily)
MTSNIRMVIADVDGTLVTSEKVLTARAAEAAAFNGGVFVRDWLVRDTNAPHVAREQWIVKFPPTVVSEFSSHLNRVAKIAEEAS